MVDPSAPDPALPAFELLQQLLDGQQLQLQGLLQVQQPPDLSSTSPDVSKELEGPEQGAAVQWFMDAYGHCKTIAHDEATQLLLDKAGVEKDGGVVAVDKFVDVGTRRHWAREAKVRDLA